MTRTDEFGHGLDEDLDWSLRPASASEALALARLQLRARRAAGMPQEPRPEAELAADLAAGVGPDEVWVCAGAGEEALGYVRFVLPDAQRVGWLDDLYVDPLHAGQGVGGALLALVQGWLPSGFGLWAFADNRAARAFYARHGLREAEHVAAIDSPTGHDEIRLFWSPEDPVTVP